MSLDITFADATEIVVADLVEGDFVEVIATQQGVRGMRVNSGVKTIERGRFDAWGQSFGRGRARMPVESIRLTFLAGHSIEIPATFTATARRRTS